ncbi:hypothetical protein HT136_02410 [Novosphingobium profundi]|uniref:hypothetical protein n=1 Tax=Novosphingobium profundi TaxID=1774954 RepID=UPI001BDB2805|nr:hypothetical protein [Novosphingobium profundi]MBT0667219.1 hypothetical protein [Novosphingobium profundi]
MPSSALPLAPLPQERALAILMPTAAFFLSWWQAGRIPGVNISISDVLLSLAAVLALSLGGLNARMFSRFTAIWVTGLTMLLEGMLIGSLAHDDFVRWPVVAGQYTFAMLLVPMVLVSCPHRVLERCANAYILGVASSQVIGITLVNLLERDRITALVNEFVVTGNGRLGAMTGEPNSNGAVCAFALVFLIRGVMTGHLRMPYALALALALIAGLVYSATFTGTFAALLTCAFILGLSRLRTSIAIAVPLALVLAAYVGFGGPVPSVFEERVGDAVLTGDPTRAGTFVGRSALIAEAWQMADDNLLVGLGSDGYRVASPHGMPVHQLYLLVLNEGGLVSILGLCLMALALLLQGQEIARVNRVEGVACLAILGVFFIYTMSLPHMFARLWNAPVMLLFALAWVATRHFHAGAQAAFAPNGEPYR